MKPFLRSSDRGQLAPVGWVSEAAGRWEGRPVDVVYDPRRHDVLFVPYDPGAESRTRFAEVGYRRAAIDGECEMWSLKPCFPPGNRSTGRSRRNTGSFEGGCGFGLHAGRACW